jgi:hypothetical protein
MGGLGRCEDGREGVDWFVEVRVAASTVGGGECDGCMGPENSSLSR